MGEDRAVIGIDLGSFYFVVDSNGNMIRPPQTLVDTKHEIWAAQQKLNQLAPGTRQRRNMKKAIQKIQRRLRHPDVWAFVTDLALAYLRVFDVVCVEDIPPAASNHQTYPFAVWRMFLNVLNEQGDRNKTEVVRVDPRLTSQRCCNCGDRNLTIGKAQYFRCKCGLFLHRDINAAINIKKRGIALLGQQEESLNKLDLIKLVRDETGLPLNRTAEAVDAVFKHLKEALLDGDRILIHGFGRWDVTDTPATNRINPHTGEKFRVPARKRVAWYPTDTFKQEVNEC